MTTLLRAEWTKFRTVPGWVLGMLAAAAAIVGLGLLPGLQGSCGKQGAGSECRLPVGPDGTEVTDTFYFVHRPLTGDGSITARVAALTGLLPAIPGADAGAAGPVHAGAGASRPGLVPWAKSGLIVRAGTGAGSHYAAIMLTGGHGVRMQYDYTHDIAGPAGTGPVWLRLERSGDAVTGSVSTDGTQWTVVGTARLDGLPATVPAGLFAASPQYIERDAQMFGLEGDSGGPSQVTGAFEHLDRRGGWADGDWTGERIGGTDNAPFRGGFTAPPGGGLTVSGSGDLAPAVSGAAGLGTSVSQTLVGTFVGLLVVVVIGAMVITVEYRRGLIRTTFAASPGRGRVLAAKAVVVGAVAFGLGTAAAAVVVGVGQPLLRSRGVYVHPASLLIQIRLVVGTGVLLAVAAVLALAIGTVLRRSAAAVAGVVVVIVLPYLLAITVLPTGAAQWLLRVSPAAAFAIQQSAVRYAQVDNIYTPADGYFPLAPWVGFAVLCGWTAVALAGAAVLLRRRDA
jgi:ABC-type transport system involved in multi-copper enzyme maturation permease subunit